MKIKLPEFCITALVGVSGAGKSTFAKKFFKATEVLSSDFFRGLVCDDELDQSISKEAFEALYKVAEKRLQFKKLTVIDATNVQKDSRKDILNLAKTYHCFAVAIVLNVPESTALARNKLRPDRNIGPGPVRRQMKNLKKTIKSLKDEGFRYVYVLNSLEEIESVEIVREKLWTNRCDEEGPFDIIGDVHGCYDELLSLMNKLGYLVRDDLLTAGQSAVISPPGRKLIFVGDLVDRGPNSPQVIKLVMNMVNFNQALCVAGNHDVKLVKFLKGQKVKLTHGLQESADQYALETDAAKEAAKEFLDKLISHYVLDQGRLVVCHAGLKEELQGRSSVAVREFALYGETHGERDEYGLPVRANWAKDYRGKALVVYGHTPVPVAQFYNNTICLDTGCVFGGKLSALRYPENELVSVVGGQVYCEPIRPLRPSSEESQSLQLNIKDVLGKKQIETSLLGAISIKSENAKAALEVMSRFAIDPRWLIYLPPTMGPTAVPLDGEADHSSYLEYPTQGIHEFKAHGLKRLIFEEKHMGSRAVMIICKDDTVPESRFSIPEKKIGVIYTRTGRAFFSDTEMEQEVLRRIQKTLSQSGLWDSFETDWVCLDVEVMPWTAKAMELLRTQYATVGASAKAALGKSIHSLENWRARNLPASVDVEPGAQNVLSRLCNTAPMIDQYIEAYRRYCDPFSSIEDLKIAPFHILATEGCVHTDKSHLWHLEQISLFCKQDQKILKQTQYRLVDVDDSESIKSVENWWRELTQSGGEGCVIKSFDFIARKEGRLLQPMLKCRGREYLRIIYGPTYLDSKNLPLLRKRSVAWKRKLALTEFSLGIEALQRFVRRAPLWQVHECVFGILALESEPVDPRL